MARDITTVIYVDDHKIYGPIGLLQDKEQLARHLKINEDERVLSGLRLLTADEMNIVKAYEAQGNLYRKLIRELLSRTPITRESLQSILEKGLEDEATSNTP